MSRCLAPLRLRAAGVLILLAAGHVSGAGAQALGRVLMTPEQRADLVRTRQAQAAILRGEVPPPQAPSMPASPASAAAASVAPMPQRVEGWVLRADGRSTVWVDGTPFYGFDTPGPARDALARRGLLAGGSATGGLKARPGQVLQDPAERRTTDLLPEGAMRIRRAPPVEAPSR